MKPTFLRDRQIRNKLEALSHARELLRLPPVKVSERLLLDRKTLYRANRISNMKRIHIIGGKNHGKTTLVAELVQALSAQGYQVGTIKHTHHQHELDTPGKDSFIHRQAGANVVGIVAKNLSAVFWATPDRCLDAEDKYEQFQRLMTDCDLVLVEGDQHTNAPKIEVWRADVGSMPLAGEDKSILAVVSDDFVPVECVIYPRRELSSLLTTLFKSLIHRNDTVIDEFTIPISKTH